MNHSDLSLQARFAELGLQIVEKHELEGNFASRIWRITVQLPSGEVKKLLYKNFQAGRDRELQIYHDLYPFIHDKMPKLYGLYKEDPKGILMADLGHSMKKRKVMAEKYILQVVDGLADLHASLQGNVDTWLAAGKISTYPYSDEWAYWTISQLEKINLINEIPILQEIIPNFYPYYPRRITAPVTITHGDPHLDNVFISGNKVLFIDWEWCSAASPVRDLSILLQDIYDQDLHRRIVEYYYRSLAERGYPITKEQYDNDLRLCLIDNTIMMLGWEVELFFMQKLTSLELQHIVMYKIELVNRLWGEYKKMR